MNCPRCGEICRCSDDAPSRVDSPQEQKDSIPGDGPAWRDELTARVARYRSRHKPPPPRYPSLQLQFDPVEIHKIPRIIPPVPPRRANFEPVSDQALALEGLAPSPATETLPRPPEGPPETAASEPTTAAQSRAKIIEFPRFSFEPPAPPPDQLAEPVDAELRILEAPAVAPPPPALGGITIEPVERQEAEKQPGIDIPLQRASLGRRISAGLIDGVIVLLASTAFGLIFWKVAGIHPPPSQLWWMAAGMPCLFWVAYQYLLVVHAGRTPGLRAAGLELARFDGTATNRSVRRWRVIASFLSAASLGMGYAWVLLDEDVLCWHDRITRTYLAPRT
jgi:uncharacterized RDD family membrane protein YckC